MKKSSSISRSERFARKVSADVAQFTESISFDWRLWEYDILGSIAHATMLQKVGLLSKKELRAIIRGFDAIGKEIAAGKFKWNPALEDVHMNIETELTRRVPASGKPHTGRSRNDQADLDIGAKLHTGRSRNDQVALDMRLWLRDEIVLLLGEIADLQRALVTLGKKNSDVLIPGYTHLQRAQPVYLAHHLLAYVEMLERDCERLWDCHSRVNVCPLGSGAIAGSTLPLDRVFVAKLLGFVDANGKPQLTQNSMDAVSDRDFAVEFCAAAALLAVHISRLAEDLILWASTEFSFIKIADAYTTGSSIMPQKKNPDIAELARGKSGRVIGNLVALLTLLKGLPMTYNRDLQEDKERLFDTADTVRATTRLMAAMLRNTKINRAACAAAASDPAMLVTDLADYLFQQFLTPRTEAVAHELLYADQYAKNFDPKAKFDPATGKTNHPIELPTEAQEDDLLCPPHQIQASLERFKADRSVFKSEKEFLKRQGTEAVQNYYRFWLKRYGVNEGICRAKTRAYLRMRPYHKLLETTLKSCMTKHGISEINSQKFKMHAYNNTVFAQDFFAEVSKKGCAAPKEDVIGHTLLLLNKKKGD
jgi:argininosuccinate lyase